MVICIDHLDGKCAVEARANNTLLALCCFICAKYRIQTFTHVQLIWVLSIFDLFYCASATLPPSPNFMNFSFAS